MRSLLFAAPLIVSLMGFSPSAQAASSFMMPQPMPEQGPWFEGWYVRVTDVENHRSFATITTSSIEKPDDLTGSPDLPGYVAFLYSETGSNKTNSIEYLPQTTHVTTDYSDPNTPHFSWESSGYGSLTDRELALALPSGDEISVKFGERLPWNAQWETWGPEGWSAYLPFVPLAWWVDSLGTPVTYRVKLKTGEVVTGRGFAHVEKNWGRVFPRAWMWLQATSPDNKSHVAIAGGPLGLGPIELNSYLIGFKTRNNDVEIRPDEALVSYATEIDSCKGRFKLSATHGRDRLEVLALAPPSSFAPVSIPTTLGFEANRGKESFVAKIKVSYFLDEQLVEAKTFDGGALEFGADFMECAADGSRLAAPTR